jgi:hypothetical protein
LFILLVLEESVGIFFPDMCLFRVDFLLIDFFLSFLLYLPGKILTHFTFLLFLHTFLPFFLLFFFLQLVLDVPHHLIIFGFDLLLLVFDD